MSNPDTDPLRNPWFFLVACLPFIAVAAVAMHVSNADQEGYFQNRMRARFATLPLESSLKPADKECVAVTKRRSSFTCAYWSHLDRPLLANNLKDLYAQAGWKHLENASPVDLTMTFCKGDETVQVQFAGDDDLTAKRIGVAVALLQFPSCSRPESNPST